MPVKDLPERNGVHSEPNPEPRTDGDKSSVEFDRRTFVSGGLGAAAVITASEALSPDAAQAADLIPNVAVADPTGACDAGPDFSNTPQRLHVYPSSTRAQDLVKSSIAIDSLFSGVWPSQWSSPEAPEFHDIMDQVKAAGFTAIAACPSADALDSSFVAFAKSAQFYIRKINERPDKYKIVRTTKDIDAAIAEDKLGIFFTHQGTAIFDGDLDRVGFWRQLGYGYCLLAYNTRNTVADGCFEPDNGRLTGFGKLLIDAYNRYGMVVDVSHTGERSAMDAVERSSQPVISSHSVSLTVSDYPRSHSDELIKAIAETGGVCAINCVGGFLDTNNPDVVTTDLVFRHVDHLVNLVGIDHVGYGSDWVPDVTQSAIAGLSPLGDLIFPDGGILRAMSGKGVRTPSPQQFIAALVDTMLENGYSEADCGKFIGGNLYRVFDEVWT